MRLPLFFQKSLELDLIRESGKTRFSFRVVRSHLCCDRDCLILAVDLERAEIAHLDFSNGLTIFGYAPVLPHSQREVALADENMS